MCVRVCSHLDAFSSGGPQRPPDDLLHHIWQQTGCYQKDYTEPGRTAGQHLHEHVVHPLVVQERPGSNKMGKNKRQKTKSKCALCSRKVNFSSFRLNSMPPM